MISQSKYEFKKELTNMIIDLNCLKALEKILLDNSMEYQICLGYKNGDTLYDLKIKDIEEDISKEKRKIVSITINAYNDNTRLRFNIEDYWIKQLEINSNDKAVFLQLKQETQEWCDLYRNKNPMAHFTPFTEKSELIRGITSIILSILTIVPVIIHDIIHNVSVKAGDCIMMFLSFVMLYYLVTLAISAIFLKKVEIDIGVNNVKIRRNVGYIVLTTIIIPTVLSWILSFI